MSLFVAVRPDEAAIDDLAEAVDRVRRSPAATALRWQPPSQWHVTLAFLGEPREVDLDDIASRLAPLAERPVVPGVRIASAGCFGRQILWMGVGDDDQVAALTNLALAVPPLLRGSGLAIDRRPWRGHLTVARARHGDARPVVAQLAGYRGPSWDVDTLLLVQSTGGPHPQHRVVHGLPLR
jgi:RNA 2',3'-cyclic 3'-phosphodiesterase